MTETAVPESTRLTAEKSGVSTGGGDDPPPQPARAIRVLAVQAKLDLIMRLDSCRFGAWEDTGKVGRRRETSHGATAAAGREGVFPGAREGRLRDAVKDGDDRFPPRPRLAPSYRLVPIHPP
jgi:hypothetical protein